ncbi:29446_t:CDS:2 [Gigaspora margarita]|uniref:29446_t:CDS:1 n=1 Tax=Gigaspora margarita TaxID=4874 RepID=A0ABN7UKZ3_GIGMA|nr:29446_t:CDS:2 [Gigaspora margarita]
MSAINARSAVNAVSAMNAYIKKEMTEEKGLDPNIADHIKLKASTNGPYQNIVNSKAVTEQSKPSNK